MIILHLIYLYSENKGADQLCLCFRIGKNPFFSFMIGPFQPDSSQIVSRLMQIRDYIKQAGAMMETLKKSGDPVGSSLLKKNS